MICTSEDLPLSLLFLLTKQSYDAPWRAHTQMKCGTLHASLTAILSLCDCICLSQACHCGIHSQCSLSLDSLITPDDSLTHARGANGVSGAHVDMGGGNRHVLSRCILSRLSRNLNPKFFVSFVLLWRCVIGSCKLP